MPVVEIRVVKQEVEQVMEHGEFSARGAILDIYPMGSKMPFRLDFFDDEIDEISRDENDYDGETTSKGLDFIYVNIFLMTKLFMLCLSDHNFINIVLSFCKYALFLCNSINMHSI